MLQLPAPSNDTHGTDATEGSSGGEGGVKLDALGPMVVNSDGVSTFPVQYQFSLDRDFFKQTLSRITNWNEMTETERQRTMRTLAARNKFVLIYNWVCENASYIYCRLRLAQEENKLRNDETPV